MSTYLHACQGFSLYFPYFFFFIFLWLGAFSFRRVALGARFWQSCRTDKQCQIAGAASAVSFQIALKAPECPILLWFLLLPLSLLGGKRPAQEKKKQEQIANKKRRKKSRQERGKKYVTRTTASDNVPEQKRKLWNIQMFALFRWATCRHTQRNNGVFIWYRWQTVGSKEGPLSTFLKDRKYLLP